MRTALLNAARQFGEIAPEFAFEKKGYWSWRLWRRRLSEETVVAPLQYAETVQALEVTMTMLVHALYDDANEEKKPPNARDHGLSISIASEKKSIIRRQLQQRAVVNVRDADNDGR